jgi:hypothetical protein
MPQRAPCSFVSDGTGITAETFGNAILAQFDFHATPRAPALHRHRRTRPTRRCARSTTRAELEGKQADRLHHAGRPCEVLGHRARGLQGHAAGHVRHLRARRWSWSWASKATTAWGVFPTSARARNTTTASKPSTSAWPMTTARATATWKAADVILVGVSRSGKTPTSLYLAMQHGLKAANYPLIPEDFERRQLPPALVPHKKKIVRPDHRARAPVRNPQQSAAPTRATPACRTAATRWPKPKP